MLKRRFGKITLFVFLVLSGTAYGFVLDSLVPLPQNTWRIETQPRLQPFTNAAHPAAKNRISSKLLMEYRIYKVFKSST